MSSGLKDKLKSVENGSVSLAVPALSPLQLGRTHVKVVADRSNRKYSRIPFTPEIGLGPSMPSQRTQVLPWCKIWNNISFIKMYLLGNKLKTYLTNVKIFGNLIVVKTWKGNKEIDEKI